MSFNPIFLGSVTKGKFTEYYFYGIKDIKGRIIKYASYPYWARGSDLPDALDIWEVPNETVISEVNDFSKGRLKIEVLKPKRGPSKVTRILVPEVSNDTPSLKEVQDELSKPRCDRVEPSVPPDSDGNRCRKSDVLETPDGDTVTRSSSCGGVSIKRSESIRSQETSVPNEAGTSDVIVKQKRHRRTKLEMQAYRESLLEQKND